MLLQSCVCFIIKWCFCERLYLLLRRSSEQPSSIKHSPACTWQGWQLNGGSTVIVVARKKGQQLRRRSQRRQSGRTFHTFYIEEMAILLPTDDICFLKKICYAKNPFISWTSQETGKWRWKLNINQGMHVLVYSYTRYWIQFLTWTIMQISKGA